MASDTGSTAKGKSTWSFVLMGFLLGAALTLLTGIVEYGAIQSWYHHLPVQPDFEGNGMSWLFLGLMLQTPVEVGSINLIVFVILLPLLFADHRDRNLGRIRYWPVLPAIAAFILVVNVLLIGWGGTHEIFTMITLPILLLTLGGSAFMIRIINHEFAGG